MRIPRFRKCWCMSSQLQNSHTQAHINQPQQSIIKSNEQFLEHRNNIFEEELNRQRKSVKRFEKIDVFLKDSFVKSTSFSFHNATSTFQQNIATNNQHQNEEDVVHLRMHKHISTPYDCAMHISSTLAERSALAILNGQPWDLHKPFDESDEYKLEFVHFKESNAQRSEIVNKAYIRSCTLILGYLLETCFKQEYFVELCSFPPVNLKSNCVVYDAKLNLNKLPWTPKSEELRCMSVQAYQIRDKAYKFEPLRISVSIATEMFKANKMKIRQINAIKARLKEDNCKIPVYRCGQYVDICQGPCIGNSQLIGRFEVAGIHRIDTPSYGYLDRIQALSIPSDLHLHYWTFDWLLKRAANLSSALVPSINVK
ncbi:hypothetical protein GJ496_011013 [Pomphorhynchus laevis]|nr:hypothetical protein GJ496_011013 [Pomphorhynchus laevis]